MRNCEGKKDSVPCLGPVQISCLLRLVSTAAILDAIDVLAGKSGVYNEVPIEEVHPNCPVRPVSVCESTSQACGEWKQCESWSLNPEQGSRKKKLQNETKLQTNFAAAARRARKRRNMPVIRFPFLIFVNATSARDSSGNDSDWSLLAVV
ncbi:hypothetical protein BJX62DRAFT_93451 [Aspergillus germanicus]